MIQPQNNFCCFRFVMIHITFTHCYKLEGFLLNFCCFSAVKFAEPNTFICNIFTVKFAIFVALTTAVDLTEVSTKTIRLADHKNPIWIILNKSIVIVHFVPKFPNVRYHGNRGFLESVKLTDPENIPLL